ncbi:MAG: lipid A deacylase LpxR family protein [Akkermansia sp.]|nr:lipid A deacylase LpxR family protein [Akkermansia sp.]
MSAIPWLTMAILSPVVGYYNPIPQPGEPGYEAVPQHHFRGTMENDSAFDKDSDYSHGTRLDYAQSLANGDAWGVSLTQNIYTPTTHTDGAVQGEHPYAGHMAVGAAYLMRGEDFGNAIEFQLGTTGNASLARYMQNGLHEACGMETWDGWNDQVPSEVTVQLSAQQNIRIPWLEMTSSNGMKSDAAFILREEAGTAYIRGGAGVTVRYGRNLPPAMQVNGNRAAQYGVALLEKPDYDPAAPSYFVTGGAYVEYVARDFAVDGGVFHHFNQTCSRVPWQAEFRLGVGVSYQGIDYFVGGVYCTDSYRNQKENTFYGTFSISWHW